MTAAAFRYEKGHETLVRAIAEFQEQLNNCHFLFAGEGPLKEQTQRLVKDLKIEDKIRFLGNRTDMPALLKASDVFVLPSYFEGLPRSVAEAMAAGLPVIATSVSGTPELVDDGITGILIPSQNSHILGQALIKLKDDKQLAVQMGKAGQDKAYREYDIQKVVHKIELLYRELLIQKGEL